MYRHGDEQISLTDFEQPMGMKLREDNRLGQEGSNHPLGED